MSRFKLSVRIAIIFAIGVLLLLLYVAAVVPYSPATGHTSTKRIIRDIYALTCVAGMDKGFTNHVEFLAEAERQGSAISFVKGVADTLINDGLDCPEFYRNGTFYDSYGFPLNFAWESDLSDENPDEEFLAGENGLIVWSSGKNGVNELGSGDDIYIAYNYISGELGGKTVEGKTIDVQIALEHEDGRVLSASAVAPGDRLSLSVTVINVGQRGVFLRTDSGVGLFVDINWVAGDGSNVGWIHPSGEISMPTGRAWARYKYLAGTDEAGEIDGSVRDDQIARLSREIRIPEEAANAQSILLSVWLDLEYAVMRSDGFTSRREERQFRLRPIGN